MFYLPLVDSVIFQRTVWNISHNCEKFQQSFVFLVPEKRLLSAHTEVVMIMVKCCFFFFFSVAEKRQIHRDRDRETKPERELGFVSIVLELESLG